MILITLYRNTEHPERAIPARQALVAGGAAGPRGPHDDEWEFGTPLYYVNREFERDRQAARWYEVRGDDVPAGDARNAAGGHPYGRQAGRTCECLPNKQARCSPFTKVAVPTT